MQVEELSFKEMKSSNDLRLLWAEQKGASDSYRLKLIRVLLYALCVSGRGASFKQIPELS